MFNLSKEQVIEPAVPGTQWKRCSVKAVIEPAVPGIQWKRNPAVNEAAVPGFNWRAVCTGWRQKTYSALETFVSALRHPPLEEILKWSMTRRDEIDAINKTYIPADGRRKL